VIVQTVYELACIYSDNGPGYKPVSAQSLVTLMSFTAQPAADLRLVRPECGRPGNNDRCQCSISSETAPLHPSKNIIGYARFAEVVPGSSIRHWSLIQQIIHSSSISSSCVCVSVVEPLLTQFTGKSSADRTLT